MVTESSSELTQRLGRGAKYKGAQESFWNDEKSEVLIGVLATWG